MKLNHLTLVRALLLTLALTTSAIASQTATAEMTTVTTR